MPSELLNPPARVQQLTLKGLMITMNMQKTIHAVLEAITEVLEQTTTNGNVTSEKLRKAQAELAKKKTTDTEE